MKDSEKLDKILEILDKQQQEYIIYYKWKPLIDLLEKEKIEPVVIDELVKLKRYFSEKSKNEPI